MRWALRSRLRWPRRSADLQTFLEESESRLEPGRAGAFQSGGKPARSGAALRLHGDLHDAAVRPGQSPACAARPGLARIRRSGEQRQAAFAALAGAAGRRDAAAGSRTMVDAGEIFHPLRWVPGRGLAIVSPAYPTWKAPVWWCACRPLARQPPAAPAGHGDGWRPTAVAASVSTDCSISTWP